ncbi:hypothetical protein NDU88_001770 [Pleurodeles waltl]|uniref:Secreted protein n=1 Tax=Pleurodeles waltl TaxID=8319 RepID=A0AAV7UUA1_PLEWA|nr:hypothetical protein NDU88_001770 [Pleurodeles waltl]
MLLAVGFGISHGGSRSRQQLSGSFVWLHCCIDQSSRRAVQQTQCSVICLELSAAWMPPKGVKTALPAPRGKQTRLDGARGSGGVDAAKM